MRSELYVAILFIFALFVSPIYAVAIGLGLLVFTPISRVKYFYFDVFAFFFIVYVSFFYLQIENISTLKEILRYVVGPFLFYFIGKSNKTLFKHHKRLLFYLLIIFSAFSIFTFFKDVLGNFSLNLDNNYYYNSRNKLVIKRDLTYTFLNETNLSLLVVTCIFFANILIRRIYLKLIYFAVFGSVLLILSSRAAIFTTILILLFNFWKYDSLKTKFFKFMFFGISFSVLIINVNFFDIPYLSTFFKVTMEKSFSSGSIAFGLGDRFVHYFNAVNNSGIFDVKGYQYLLNTFGFSSHNEILGHTSAVGIVPSLLFFFILFSIIRRTYKNLDQDRNITLYKVVSCMLISYLVIGMTENIFVSNTVWFYVLMLMLGISSVKRKYV